MNSFIFVFCWHLTMDYAKRKTLWPHFFSEMHNVITQQLNQYSNVDQLYIYS